MKPGDISEVQNAIKRYSDMRDINSASGMLREATFQYMDMASGGDGGPLGYWPEDYAKRVVDSFRPFEPDPTCRTYNYPNYPDSYFQEVCDGMGWEW